MNLKTDASSIDKGDYLFLKHSHRNKWTISYFRGKRKNAAEKQCIPLCKFDDHMQEMSDLQTLASVHP